MSSIFFFNHTQSRLVSPKLSWDHIWLYHGIALDRNRIERQPASGHFSKSDGAFLFNTFARGSLKNPSRCLVGTKSVATQLASVADVEVCRIPRRFEYPIPFEEDLWLHLEYRPELDNWEDDADFVRCIFEHGVVERCDDSWVGLDVRQTRDVCKPKDCTIVNVESEDGQNFSASGVDLDPHSIEKHGMLWCYGYLCSQQVFDCLHEHLVFPWWWWKEIKV